MHHGEHDILIERHGALGLVTLNRPHALNALNDPMVDGLRAALDEWREDTTIRHVLVRGAGGKAFSAGGDIRLMHDLGRSGRHDVALDFWAREYRLNSVIQHYPKPYISLIDGIVMGGGVGVSLHGSHRLAGPNYLFAMPEVGIGFFPDVGASYALPRLPGHAGAWLAVTGARIRRADALELGLATHAVRPGCEEELIMHLSAGIPVEAAIARISDVAGDAPIHEKLEQINRFFAFDSVPEIVAALEAAGPDNAFAAETLAGMRGKSPTSMAIAIEQIRRGKSMDFDATMVMEFRIVNRLIHDPDFYEGVRALIIDKDNRPHWTPARIEDVEPAKVAAHFAPLPHDLDLPGACSP